MIGAIVATHGPLAAALLETARGIVGKLEQVEAIAVDAHARMEDLRAEVRRTVGALDSGEGVIVLADMLGGTPANVSLLFLDELRVEVVTGVNLPMVLKLASSRDDGKSLEETARLLAEYGQKNIHVASAEVRARRGPRP